MTFLQSSKMDWGCLWKLTGHREIQMVNIHQQVIPEIPNLDQPLNISRYDQLETMMHIELSDWVIMLLLLGPDVRNLEKIFLLVIPLHANWVTSWEVQDDEDGILE